MNLFTEISRTIDRAYDYTKRWFYNTRLVKFILYYDISFSSLFGLIICSFFGFFYGNINFIYAGMFLVAIPVGFYIDYSMEGEKKEEFNKEAKMSVIYIAFAWGAHYVGFTLAGVIPLLVMVISIIHFYRNVYPDLSD